MKSPNPHKHFFAIEYHPDGSYCLGGVRCFVYSFLGRDARKQFVVVCPLNGGRWGRRPAYAYELVYKFPDDTPVKIPDAAITGTI